MYTQERLLALVHALLVVANFARRAELLVADVTHKLE